MDNESIRGGQLFRMTNMKFYIRLKLVNPDGHDDEGPDPTVVGSDLDEVVEGWTKGTEVGKGKSCVVGLTTKILLCNLRQ